MRKSLMAFVAIAAMVALTSAAAKATETAVYIASGAATPAEFLGNAGAPSVAGAGGSLSNGWVYAVVGTSNSPSSQPLFGLESFTIEAYCAGGGCTIQPLYVLVSDVLFASVPGLWTTLDVTAEPTSGSTAQAAGFDATTDGYFNFFGSVGPPLSVSGSASSLHPLTGSAYYTASVTGPFSESLQDLFTSGGATGATSAFTAMGEIGATPEPRTLLLFGTGLFLVGAFIRRCTHKPLRS
jgi:hypothetical protein